MLRCKSVTLSSWKHEPARLLQQSLHFSLQSHEALQDISQKEAERSGLTAEGQLTRTVTNMAVLKLLTGHLRQSFIHSFLSFTSSRPSFNHSYFPSFIQSSLLLYKIGSFTLFIFFLLPLFPFSSLPFFIQPFISFLPFISFCSLLPSSLPVPVLHFFPSFPPSSFSSFSYIPFLYQFLSSFILSFFVPSPIHLSFLPFRPSFVRSLPHCLLQLIISSIVHLSSFQHSFLSTYRPSLFAS